MTADQPATGQPATGQPTTGQPATGHPTLETLAEWDEDLLDDATTRTVHRHVATCGSCQAAVATLVSLRGDLRALPAPTLPAEVLSGLDAVLAGLATGHHVEASAIAAAATGPHAVADPHTDTDTDDGVHVGVGRSGGTGSGADPDAAPGSTRRGASIAELVERERRAQRVRRWTGWAAAAVIVLGLGVGVRSLANQSDGSSSAATSAGSSQNDAHVPLDQQSRHNPGDGETEPPKRTASGPAAVAYSHATLQAALSNIARDAIVPASASGAGSPSADSVPTASCRPYLPNHAGTLLLVRLIKFDGRPALVAVYVDGQVLTGRVMTRNCGPGSTPTLLDTVVAHM